MVLVLEQGGETAGRGRSEDIRSSQELRPSADHHSDMLLPASSMFKAYRRRSSREKGENQFLQVRRRGREGDLLLLLPSDGHDDDRLMLTEPLRR